MSVGLQFNNLMTVVCFHLSVVLVGSLLLGEEELLEVALWLTTAYVTTVGTRFETQGSCILQDLGNVAGGEKILRDKK